MLDGASLFCPNENGCRAQVVQRMCHTFSKGALDWDGFGPAQVEALIDKCGCKTLSDVLALDPDAITPVLGPGQKRKFLAERERIKDAPLWRKYAALGIEGVGQVACKELCEDWHSLDDIVNVLAGADLDDVTIVAKDLPKLESILGPVACHNFLAYIQNHAKELAKCELYGYALSEVPPAKIEGGLAGKTFVLTGAMMTGSRTQVQAIIEKHGGKCKGSVSKGVDFLVVGEAGGASKANAAKKHGTRCITEEELFELMGIPMPIASVEAANEWD